MALFPAICLEQVAMNKTCRSVFLCCIVVCLERVFFLFEGSDAWRLVPCWRRGRRRCLRGRRGAWRHRPSFCVAGMALGDIDRHFAWQAWHLWHWAGSGGALGSRLAPWAPRLFRGRCAWRHRPSLCVAGVALGDMDVHFACRCGTWRHGSSLCVACWTWFDMSAEADIDFDCRAGNLHVLFWRCAQIWKMFSSGTSVLFCFGSSYTYARTHTHAHIAHACRWPHNAHIHTCTHKYTRTFTHDFITHTHTHHFYPLLHTFLSRTSLRHTFVALADPSPSLFSFLHVLRHVYLSFAAYWKKLTCEVIRSFNFFLVLINSKTMTCRNLSIICQRHGCVWFHVKRRRGSFKVALARSRLQCGHQPFRGQRKMVTWQTSVACGSYCCAFFEHDA